MKILKLIGAMSMLIIIIIASFFLALILYGLGELAYIYYKSGQDTNCILMVILILLIPNFIKTLKGK